MASGSRSNDASRLTPDLLAAAARAREYWATRRLHSGEVDDAARRAPPRDDEQADEQADEVLVPSTDPRPDREPSAER